MEPWQTAIADCHLFKLNAKKFPGLLDFVKVGNRKTTPTYRVLHLVVALLAVAAITFGKIRLEFPLPTGFAFGQVMRDSLDTDEMKMNTS